MEEKRKIKAQIIENKHVIAHQAKLSGPWYASLMRE